VPCAASRARSDASDTHAAAPAAPATASPPLLPLPLLPRGLFLPLLPLRLLPGGSARNAATKSATLRDGDAPLEPPARPRPAPFHPHQKKKTTNHHKTNTSKKTCMYEREREKPV
jgi:hypothetical protein